MKCLRPSEFSLDKSVSFSVSSRFSSFTVGTLTLLRVFPHTQVDPSVPVQGNLIPLGRKHLNRVTPSLGRPHPLSSTTHFFRRQHSFLQDDSLLPSAASVSSRFLWSCNSLTALCSFVHVFSFSLTTRVLSDDTMT